MGTGVKFLHTADIHLGSILHIKKKNGNELSEVFNNAVYDTFERICDTAIEENVNFILISGDIYDKEARSIKANGFFIKQCRRLEQSNIKVFVICGNHDPFNDKSEIFSLPENVFIFSQNVAETVEFRDLSGALAARIIGQSYKDNWDSRKMYLQYEVPHDGVLNIAMLHTQLDGSSNYVPCMTTDLKNNEGIDYWALGHIHKQSIINANSPAIVFPGIPQGRDFGEEELGGVYIVAAQGKEIESMKFIPIEQVLLIKKYVDFEEQEDIELNNLSDLENLLSIICEEVIQSKAKMAVKGLVVKLIIKGKSEIYSIIKDREDETEEYLIESLNNRFSSRNPFIFIDSIMFNLERPIENYEIIKSSNQTIQEIINISEECIEKLDIRQRLIKELGTIWESIDSLEDMNIKKLQLTDEMYQYIIQQAEQLCIDTLLQRSEED